MVVAAGIVFICISGGGKPPTYLLQGASLLSSCTRTLAVFQYSKPETLERKARPSNPVARPTDRPTSPHPSARPLSGQCTPNRHIWTKSNRILSKRFPRPPLQSPSTGGRKPYARRFSTKAGLSPPPPRLLSMEKWKPFLWISSLSLSISLFPLLFLGRGGSVIRTGRGQECCCAIFRWMYRIFNGRIGSIFYLRKNLSVSLSLSLARIISDDFDSPLQKRTSPNAWNQFNIYIYISNRKKKENSSSFSTSV